MNINSTELKEANDFIDHNLERLISWSIGDISKCCRITPEGNCVSNGALVGAFILWCCAIDYFGGLYTGRFSSRETGRRFNDFVKKYMSKYDSDKLQDLRWALLHYYSVRHFVLYHEDGLKENERKHLTPSKNGIRLHLGTAIKDLESAVNSYRKDLASSDLLKVRLLRYYKQAKPLMPIVIGDTKPSGSFNSLATGASISGSGTVSYQRWFTTKK